jgi:hypothetical protein
MLHRDHCHTHGYVRGFTCPDCNLELAFIEQFTIRAPMSSWGLIADASENGYIEFTIPKKYLKLCPEC